VTFLAIDEAIGESAASDVLTAAKTLYPEAPVLWVGADRGPERFVYAPDAIISPLSSTRAMTSMIFAWNAGMSRSTGISGSSPRRYARHR
jgi:hypothetical protein